MTIDVHSPQWAFGADGARVSFIVPSVSDAQKISDTMEPGKPYTMEIKQKRKRRSNDANSLMWALLSDMAMILRKTEPHVDPDELYCEYIRHSPNYYTATIPPSSFGMLKRDWESHGIAWFCQLLDYDSTGENYTVRLYYGSSQYDTQQMAALIDAILQDAAAIGVDTANESFKALVEQYPGGQYG